jgi:serine protease Do
MQSLHAVSKAVTVLTVLFTVAGCSGESLAQSVPSTPPAATRALPDFAGLVERYGPSVVNVQVVQKSQFAANSERFSQDDPFSEFFKRFGIPAPDAGPRGFGHGGNQPMRAAGSGFIVTSDGYILTNAHVVSQADTVTVKLTDRREYQAKVVGSDERTDVAVLKIDAKNLPTVKIGRPEDVHPGEWVVAIGSPFGFENSVTAGIVSATSRSLDSGYVPFIQTDVAVNPGNSGGPLFNLRGEVIGINSQIFSRSGGYMGLSFAIPIDVAANVQEQLVKTGHVVRGRIGVAVQDVNAQLADTFGLDRPRGALISSVQDDSPAAKAGLKAGDVILSVDGRTIENYNELAGLISRIQPGREAKLQVWRDGKARDMDVHVVKLDEPGMLNAKAQGAAPNENSSWLGLAARPLTPQEKQQAQTDGSLVVEDANGPAAAAGIRPGDIVLGVNGKPVRSIAELRAAAKKTDKSIALLIQRDDARLFVPIQPG